MTTARQLIGKAAVATSACVVTFVYVFIVSVEESHQSDLCNANINARF